MVVFYRVVVVVFLLTPLFCEPVGSSQPVINGHPAISPG